MNRKPVAVAALLLCLWTAQAFSEFRFPMPEFESGYTHPQMNLPPVSKTSPVVDVTLLLAGLALTAWSVLKLRSRRMVFMIALFSVWYFGFYRKGCVCAVGSLQNVLAAFLLPDFAVPLIVSLFFLIPLVFALYFGRVFCAAVCPLGAIQEMCAVYPVQLSYPVQSMLGLFSYAYLGITVLSIYMGAGFLICRYDPFVGFFRQGASFNMFLAGGILLLTGVFIARPYCRFLCPYGVLLRWASRFSKWHCTITPAECIQCRLCESSCPYGAIVVPTPEDRPVDRLTGAKRFGRLLLIAPLIVVVAAGAGFVSHEILARLHPTVWLAEHVTEAEQGRLTEPSLDLDAFRAGKQSSAELYAEANALKERFKYASACFGGFMGLVVCGKLIRLSTIRKSKDYEIDRGECLSCARCFAYCPVESNNAQEKEQ
ncbi:MAG TPA: 4Fe-4S binding protein [Candidatus Hydrogenedentes bacterium]|nr:4Fe-4S binding protein [Candidatus Hydrogenedentota bacterium]